MTSRPAAARRRPDARAESVEDLVRLAANGKVRVPEFQRGLRWRARDVVDLFDSVYRGYPIGSLLLSRRPAPAARLHLGPLEIEAQEVADAWWVVDGQQRLTALTASLARPEPLPCTPVDPYVVFFDPRARAFLAPPQDGVLRDGWVPVPLLLDATRLSEWIYTWAHAGDHELRSTVFEAGKRIREYRVPMYVLDSDDADLLKEIFFRVNNFGKRLKWDEVHDALYGHEGPAPNTLVQLSDELSELGMGRLKPDELTSCLLAIRGLNVTQTVADHHRRDRDVLRGAAVEALPVLRRVLHFLRTHTAVPHLRLLPRTFVLEGLARFFALHPDPGPRSLELLTRWTWRIFFTEGRHDEKTLRRRAVACIDADDEEGSLQALLGLASREAVRASLPASFDARAAHSRLVLLALTSLEPRDPGHGRPLDVPALLEARGVNAFRRIFTDSSSASNRVLLPGVDNARRVLLKRLGDRGPHDVVLASHAISPEAALKLDLGDVDEFLALRAVTLTDALRRLGDRLAGWRRQDRDRPSIRYLLHEADPRT